jgi:hypothetical protein
MVRFRQLEFGDVYFKRELAELLDEDDFFLVRDGIYNGQSGGQTFLIVDLEEIGNKDCFHLDDYWFRWDSQTTQHLHSKKIQEIINAERQVHLFIRLVQKVEGQTQPFVYCGRLAYEVDAPEMISRPINILFRSLDFYDTTSNEHLEAIYQWMLRKTGETPSNMISKGVPSEILGVPAGIQ